MRYFGLLALTDRLIKKLQNQEQQGYKSSSNIFFKNLKKLWNNRRK